MNEVKLKVTSNVLRQVKQEDKWHQAQIAVTSPTFGANSKNRKEIVLGGVIKLAVGDTHAIWYSHNKTTDTQMKDFKKLFFLLANHPDEEMKFLYSIS